METTRDISAEELAALRDPGARHGAFDRLVGAYLYCTPKVGHFWGVFYEI